MQELVSLSGNIISFDPDSRKQDIEDILAHRFEEGEILESTLDNLYDPYLLSGMKECVERLKQAKESAEKVVIFGDYDVDGVTSTSLLMHLFKRVGIISSYRLPHRVHDGYGLKKKFIDELASLGVSLIITVDCGSRDREVVSYAKEQGVDIIVTDHHHVPPDTPDDAIAFINPSNPKCNYPFAGLAGAGVAYKVVMALAREYMDDIEYRKYLTESIDIAAIGTVADCMKLTGENRIIVTLGLQQLKNSRSKGVRSLIEDKMHEDLDADVFGFLIGPRLNAAGRMDTPYKAVNLLLNNSETLSDTLSEIEVLNNERKAKTKEFVEAALENINPQDNIIFYDSPDIAHGIIGIVAGRLTEKYYKPSIVLIDEGEKLVASCRSPEYFSIVDILESYKEYFISYGGHKQAAGFSVSKEKFPEFKEKILQDVNALDFSSQKKILMVDKLIQLDQIGFRLIERMMRFKPFGMGNPRPLFLIENVELGSIKFMGSGRDHIKIENRYGFKIFGFFMGEHYESLRNAVSCSIICEICEDNYLGKRGIMLRMQDIILP